MTSTQDHNQVVSDEYMPKRSFSTDAIRAYAILIMVFFHSTGVYIKYGQIPGLEHWFLYSTFLRASTSYSVPLFVMLSGMLLLAKSEPWDVFFKKRFTKVVVPFFAWIILHILYLIFLEGKPYSMLGIIKVILKGPVYPHLWFLYTLIGLYLATPILRVFCQNSSPNDRRYFIMLWLIGCGILPIINQFWQVKINLPMIVTTSFAGYFVFGFHIKDLVLSKKQIVISSIFLLFLITTISLLLNKISGNGSRVNLDSSFGFDSFISPKDIHLILMSVLAFSIIKSLHSISNFPRIYQKIIYFLSKTSFGVYLVHYVILNKLIYGLDGDAIQIIGGELLHPVLGVFVTFIYTFLISVAITFVLQSIPFVRRIVP